MPLVDVGYVFPLYKILGSTCEKDSRITGKGLGFYRIGARNAYLNVGLEIVLGMERVKDSYVPQVYFSLVSTKCLDIT